MQLAGCAFMLRSLIMLRRGKTRSEAQAAKNAEKGTGIKMSWHRPEVHGRIGALLVQLYAADIVDERWGWEGPTKDLNHAF